MSKFQGLDSYTRQDGYELLPFKFDRLAGDDYVITNMVGEHLVMPMVDLLAVLKKDLVADHPLYASLRSKHFIRHADEQAPLDLLALKLRTKLSRLSGFTSLHIFVVTLRCDHSCPYCQVSRQMDGETSFDMTQDMAEKALDFVFRSPNPAIKIEFQGGEPLLNFEMVRFVVEAAKRRNIEEKRDLEFVIATTLSLLTDEVLEFCHENDIILSTSLDGPADLHNANRPRVGRDSFERLEAGLAKARNILGVDGVSALMTTTDKSLPRAREIIDEYVRLGFNGIFLRALSPYGFAIKTRKFMTYDTERWLEFYKEGLAYILELNKAGIPFVEHYASLILKKMLTSNDPGYVDLMNPAGAGIAAIVFNYDGSVYASDESRMLAEMGDQSFRLGNILTDSYEDIMLSDALLDALEQSFTLSAPMCSDCAFEPYCGAEPVFHHAMFNDVLGRKAESSFCKRNMSIFKHLIGLMQSDVSIRRLFMQWANAC
ncbi:His-Xaa-Ser system radical SAM maturase HxsB [Pseudomonas asplenii]|uniref:His-Xaa-Ser system radical SAM maturase HxsB n=1 Tax=Pseudomonas asplenii TaxID=53407 RepID=A0A0M9GD16_9PSED|nr:His-Xaa-Ser system radical SAM maturase HxsB [Pseudomonas fuscovaginae]KPA88206.1 His-Xaa-Ser system radical SAM maturase HxsB [Pseudomonas fuscovaginae]